MKICGYIVFVNTPIKDHNHLVKAHLKRGDFAHYWSYDSYDVVANIHIIEEIKKCNGFLFESVYNTNLNKLKLIEDYTDEELEQYLNRRK